MMSHAKSRIGAGGPGLVRAFGLAFALVIAVLTRLAPAQESEDKPGSAPHSTSASSRIEDRAGLFADGARANAARELAKIEQATGAAIVIETISGLGDEAPAKVATRMAERSGVRNGVFILIARKERKLEVLVSRAYREHMNEQRRSAVRQAFFEGFRNGDFNEGLVLGVAALAKQFSGVRRAVIDRPEAANAGAALVARNQARLTLAGARAVLAGAEAKAHALKVKENIAVVDDGGHLLAFARMDGARPASVYTAITKAVTAATLRQPSGPVPKGADHPDPLLNLSLQNAAAASGGKLTTLKGGVPIVVDGQVVGAVGVGGGTGEQDLQIANAGVQAFADRLKAPAHDAGNDVKRPRPAPPVPRLPGPLPNVDEFQLPPGGAPPDIDGAQADPAVLKLPAPPGLDKLEIPRRGSASKKSD